MSALKIYSDVVIILRLEDNFNLKLCKIKSKRLVYISRNQNLYTNSETVRIMPKSAYLEMSRKGIFILYKIDKT